MATRDSEFLAVRGIDAHDAESCASYLYVPQQLIVSRDDAEQFAADLERRELLSSATTTATASARRPSIDVRLATDAFKRFDASRVRDLVRAQQDDREPPPDDRWSQPPGQDPDADELLEALGLVRFRLTPDAVVPALVTSYRAEGWAVAPNHVVHWEPFYDGAPGDLPVPADELPPPDGRPGDGPRVVILDTGIQRGWQDDAWFRDRVDGAGAQDDEVLDADRDGVLDLQAGHGTFIASLVARGCPSATIIPRRVLNSFGLTADSDLAAAIVRAARLDPDLLVLSLGAYAADDRPLPAIERALAHLPDRTVVVAAAGNAGQSRVFWPAALKTVLAVGSHDGGDPDGDGTVDGPERRASFSNFGWWVDACADGLKAHAKFVEWDGGIDGLVGDEQEFTGWAVWSGTSFAAPIVAAALAQHMVDHGGSAHDAVRRLVRAPGLRSLVDLGAVVG